VSQQVLDSNFKEKSVKITKGEKFSVEIKTKTRALIGQFGIYAGEQS